MHDGWAAVRARQALQRGGGALRQLPVGQQPRQHGRDARAQHALAAGAVSCEAVELPQLVRGRMAVGGNLADGGHGLCLKRLTRCA